MKDSLHQQINFNGNTFGNKYCHYNEGSLYIVMYIIFSTLNGFKLK